jgi:uncharacterized coiled-coil DUF342 family protein
MNNTTEAEFTAEEVVEIKNQIAEYTEKMRRLVEEIKRDRVEIDRLKAETRAMLRQLSISAEIAM